MWLLEKLQINYSLLPIKFFYLFYYGGVSCVTPFLAHYLQQNKGLSPLDVTTILGLVPFLVIATKPLVGHIADTTKCFRLLLAGVLIIGGVFMCLISIVPAIKIDSHQLNHSQDSIQDIFSPRLKNVTNFSMEILLPSSKLQPSSHFSHYSFWLIFLCIIVGKAFGLSTAYPLMDALTLGVLGNSSNKQYGRQRMWMAVGLASALLTVSLTMDALNNGSSSALVDYRPAFIGFALCLVVSIICVFFVPLPETGLENNNNIICNNARLKSCCKTKDIQEYESDVSQSTSSHTSECDAGEGGGLRNLLPCLKQANVLLFLLMAFVCGMNFGTSVWMSTFYLKVDLHATQTGIGLVVVFYCACTMISFILSGYILNFVGHELSLAICLISYSVRALLWSIVTDPWHTMPCEVLFGLSVGLWLPTMGSYAKNLAGPHCRASAQSVLSAVFDGFGVGVGNLISGRIYQDLGGQSAWRLMSLATGICSLVYILSIACNSDLCKPPIKQTCLSKLIINKNKNEICDAKRIMLDLQKIERGTTMV